MSPKLSNVRKVFSTRAMYAIATLFALVVLYALFVRPRMERFTDKAKESFHFDGLKNCEDTTKSYSLVFFFMKTCPHCVDFRPVWDEFVNHAKSDNALSGKLCISDVSAENENLIRKYSVSAFPTVLLISNDGATKPKVFDGERSFDGLSKFVTQNISS